MSVIDAERPDPQDLTSLLLGPHETHDAPSAPVAEGADAPSVVSPPPVQRHDPRLASRLRTVVGLAALLLMVASIVYAATFALTGGKWYIVRTPSMGQAAPVGTLLWVRPTDSVHVGDMITFKPPDVNEIYSHRIHAIAADGAITTKGDANDVTDGWTLSKSDIIGKVSMRWWGMGWLVRAAPILILGGLVLWLLTRRFATTRWRLPLRVVGAAVLLSVSTFILRPLVGAQQLSLLGIHGGVRASYVSTGLLPLRLSAAGGGHTSLVSGQTGTVTSSIPADSGRFAVDLAPQIAWWWWLVLAAICFLPAVWTSASGRHQRRDARHSSV